MSIMSFNPISPNRVLNRTDQKKKKLQRTSVSWKKNYFSFTLTDTIEGEMLIM